MKYYMNINISMLKKFSIVFGVCKSLCKILFLKLRSALISQNVIQYNSYCKRNKIRVARRNARNIRSNGLYLAPRSSVAMSLTLKARGFSSRAESEANRISRADVTLWKKRGWNPDEANPFAPTLTASEENREMNSWTSRRGIDPALLLPPPPPPPSVPLCVFSPLASSFDDRRTRRPEDKRYFPRSESDDQSSMNP